MRATPSGVRRLDLKPGKPSATERRYALEAFAYNQHALQASGALEDDPNPHYLLGFEAEKVKPERPKVYIRRLWLPFESSKKPLPKLWLDPLVETFANEIYHWIQIFLSDPDKWFNEFTKKAILIDGEELRERGLFEDLVDHILIKRNWGDEIWGHRKYCRTDLFNAKPEKGDDTPPKWPQDRDRISLAVRQWIATSVQNPQRSIARAVPFTEEQIEEQNARRELLMKEYHNRGRESSPNQLALDRDETIGARQPFTIMIKKESSPSRPPEASRLTSITTDPSAALRGRKSAVASQIDAHVGLATPTASSARTSSDSVLARTSGMATRSSSKRKGSEETVSPKRRRTVGKNAAASQSNSSSRGNRGRLSESEDNFGRAVHPESSQRDLAKVAAPPVREPQARHVLRARSRDSGTQTRAKSRRRAVANQAERTTATDAPKQVSERRLRHLSPDEQSTPSPDLTTGKALVCKKGPRSKDISTASENSSPPWLLISRSSLRSASRAQVSAPTALLAGSSNSIPEANADATAIRSSSPPDESSIVEAANSDARSDPFPKSPVAPTDIRTEPPVSAERSVNQDQTLEFDAQETERLHITQGVPQLDSTTVPDGLHSTVSNVLTNQGADPPEPSQRPWENKATATAPNLFINDKWGPDLRGQLRNGGGEVQDTATSPLAKFLSDSSKFTPSIPSSLTNWQNVLSDQAEQADVTGERMHSPAHGIDESSEPPTEYVSAKDSDACLKCLQVQHLPAGSSDSTHANRRDERGAKRTVPATPRAEKQQVTFAGPVGTIPEHHFGSPLDDESGGTVINQEVEPGLLSPSPSQSGPEECQAVVATELFLSGLKNDWNRGLTSGQLSSGGQSSRDVWRVHGSDEANVQCRQEKLQHTTRKTIPAISSTSAGPQRYELTDDSMLPATRLPMSLTTRPVKGHPDQRSTSAEGITPLEDLPFPPGVSLIPRKCARCVHSLIKAFDVMKDAHGFAQWRKICHYCRGKAKRPSPCTCDMCSQLTIEEEETCAPTIETSFASQNDMYPLTRSNFQGSRSTMNLRLA
ncbi:hypothetical protein SVAN01_00649 [Stagonosporopsis vannaccii]|nr:hypothetical protein SVAN01_00649 [Stagonosporopsis vannaccii]